jgi:hypothetical protein
VATPRHDIRFRPVTGYCFLKIALLAAAIASCSICSLALEKTHHLHKAQKSSGATPTPTPIATPTPSPSGSSNETSATTVKPSVNSSSISIAIESSRTQPTAGDGLGIWADIVNVSSSPIYIKADAVDLILPPELLPTVQGPHGWYAFFPTQNPNVLPISIAPGDSYRVFWNSGYLGSVQSGESLPNQSVLQLLKSMWETMKIQMTYLWFPPADYKIAVVAKYSTTSDFSDSTSRTAVQTAVLHVSAPQLVILFGASIGGILAYLVLPQARGKLIKESEKEQMLPLKSRWLKRIFREASGLFAAMLLSTVVTILLSRISDSQFLIRVTITDIWGAIVIGFVANYLGANFINKILEKSSKSNVSEPPPPDLKPN